MTTKAYSFPKLKSKKEWLAVVLTIGLVVSGTALLGQSNRMQNLSILEEGMGTCFGRVAQSFTAKMIGEDRSVYLDKGFTTATEECFGEAVTHASAVSAATSATKAQPLTNKLANEVSFFHAKLHGQDAQFAKNNAIVQTSQLNSRFQEMENLREEIFAEVANAKAQVKASVLRSEIAFYAFALLAPIVFIMLWWQSRRQLLVNREVELEAGKSIHSGKATLNATKSLIDRVLANNELYQTKDLFDRTYALLSLEGKGNSKVRVVASGQTMASEEQVDEAWNDDDQILDPVPARELPKSLKSLVRPEGPTTDLEAVLSRTIDLFSGRIFTSGVRLEMNVAENACRIDGKNEDVEQVLYHAVSEAIDTAATGSRTMSVNLKQLGGIVIVNIDVHGMSFSEEIILEAAKVARTKPLAQVDLQICRELMNGIGKVSFENADGARRTQFVFHAREATKRVAQVTKATKRELKERMQGLSN